MLRFPQASVWGLAISLYLITGCSVTLFDAGKQKKTDPALQEPVLEFTDSSPVLETYHTSQGILWRTDYGFFLFDNEGHTRHISRDQGLPSDRVTGVAEGLGGLWIGTGRGLVSFRNGVVTPVSLPWDEERAGAEEDLTTGGGPEEQEKREPAPPEEITAIAWSDEYLGQAPAIWVGSDKGLVASVDGRVFVEVFSQIPVTHIMADSTATIWVATDNQGIIKIGAGGTMENIRLENGLPSLHVDRIALTGSDALIAWSWGNDGAAWIGFQDKNSSFWQGFSLAGLSGPAQLQELTVRERRLVAKTDGGLFEIMPFRQPPPVVVAEGEPPPPPPKLTMRPIQFTPQPPVLVPEDPFTTRYGKRTRAEEDLYSGRLLLKVKAPEDRRNVRIYNRLKGNLDRLRTNYKETRDGVEALVPQVTELEDQVAIERERVKVIKEEAKAAAAAERATPMPVDGFAGFHGFDGQDMESEGEPEEDMFIFEEEEQLWQMEDTLRASQERLSQDRERELTLRDQALAAQEEFLEFVERIAPPGTYPQWLKQSPWSNFYNPTKVEAAQFPLSMAPGAHPPMTINQWHIPDQSLTNSMVVSMNGNKHGELFLGTASLGLLGIQKSDANSRWFRANDLIPSSKGMGPAIDQQGNTWVISRDGGLFRHRKGLGLEWERVFTGDTGSRAYALTTDRRGRVQVFNQVVEGWRISRYDGYGWNHSPTAPLWLTENDPTPNVRVTSFDVDGGGRAYLALSLGERGPRGGRLLPAGVLEIPPGEGTTPIHHLMDPSRRLPFAEPGVQLPNNRVNSLRVSGNGMVWMATMSGLVRLQGTNMQLLDENRGLPGSVIRDLLTDAQDQVWIALSRGVALVNKANLQFQFYAEGEGMPTGAIQELLTGQKNSLWVFTDQALAIHKGDQFVEIELRELGINLREIRNLVFDENNRLWATTRNKLVRYKTIPDTPAEKPKEDTLEMTL